MNPPADHDGVQLDLAFLAAVVVVALVVLQVHQPLWRDQSIYHYMAWVLLDGGEPYDDVIDLNWPGILLFHVAGRLLSGAEPWGLRLIEAGVVWCTGALMVAIAAGQRVTRSWRLSAALTFFAMYYWEPAHTFQRDFVQLPFVAANAWLALRRDQRGPVWLLVLIGCCSGMALWIKPTAIVYLGIIGLGGWVLDRRRALRIVLWQIPGVLLVSLGMLVFVHAFCDWEGFLAWPMGFSVGSYAGLRRQPVDLFLDTVRHLFVDVGSPLALLAVMVLYIETRINGRKVPLPRTVVRLFLLAPVAALSVPLLQGKGFAYHYVYVLWFLSLGAFVLLGAVRGRDRLGTAALVAAIAILAVRGVRAQPPGETVRADAMAAYLEPRMAPGDQLVVLGFEPGVSSRLERHTPFPYPQSGALYFYASDQLKQRMITELLAALEEPQVRIYLVEQSSIGGMGRLLASRHTPDELLRHLGFSQVPLPATLEGTYRLWSRDE